MKSLLLQKKLLHLLVFIFLAVCSIAQDVPKVITGKIVDNATQSPIDGATVKVKNSNAIATTNDKGEFTIKVPSNESVISITHVGYMVYEVTVGSSNVLDIRLTAADKAMEEVVVVGYGTKKRSQVTGAIATIKASQIEDLSVANLGSALINRIPGVSVNYSSGKPGSTTDINIRNSVTFSGGGLTTQPLYVIDGIVINPTTFSQTPNPDFFENLDASQIEDITFLKDASAAIYGAAGAKGVILITTKKGKAGKPQLSYSGYYGVSDAAVKVKTLTAYEHAKLLNDGYAITGAANTNRFSDADLQRLKTMPNEDWSDKLWKAGKVMRHTVNVSGGSDRITFFVGGSYYDEKGNYADIYAKKYSIRTGMSAKIIDGLTVDVNFSSDYNEENKSTQKNNNAETDDISNRALFLTPKWVPLEINGNYTLWNGPNPPGNWNMLALINSGTYGINKSQGLSTNASIQYKPSFLPGLTARVQFGQLNRNATGKEYYPSYTVSNFIRNGNNGLLFSDSINANSPTTTITNNNQMSEGTTTSNSYQIMATLNYEKKIGRHDFSVMAGMDQGGARGRNIFLTKFSQIVKGVDEFWAWSNDPSSAASLTDIIRNPQAIQNNKRSFLGRLNYSFNEKYYVEAIARYDASSNFAPENRWGLFPTVGLGWMVSNEEFFNNVDFINTLKLRLNYGLVGEDRVSNKTYVNRFTQTTGYLFGNVYTNGLDPNLYPNPDATWEKSRTFNVGADVTALNNKLNVSVEFYNRYTYDAFNALDASVLPQTVGLISPIKNYGKQLSWGSEFSVGYRTMVSRNWSINADVNFGWSNSSVLQQYYNPASFGLYGSNGLSNVIGKNPRVYNSNNYGYIATGILRTQADVDALLAKNPNYTIGGAKPQVGFLNYKDIDGDGKINDNDITLMYDRTNPIAAFGITLGVTYKEFKLQTNLNLTIGGKRMYDSEARKVPTTTQNGPSFWADSWTPENPNAKFPRADAPLAREASTFWVVDGTQSRINNAVLSYAVPKRIVTRYKIPNFRVMLTGTNLWSIINPLDYKDPYTSNFASYPILRTISLGINMNL